MKINSSKHLRIWFKMEKINKNWINQEQENADAGRKNYKPIVYIVSTIIVIGAILLTFNLLSSAKATANPSSGPPAGWGDYNSPNSQDYGASSVKLAVNIPCPGHALLITNALKSINGVLEVDFDFPNVFDVKYVPAKTSKEAILSVDIFKTYEAKVVNG